MILERIFNLKIGIIKNILSIIIITIFIGCFVGCDTNHANNNTTVSKSIEAIKESQKVNSKTRNETIEEIKKSQPIAFTEIAYASKDRVIFYGNVGLIVYDIVNQQIYRAIDLQSINMGHIQGSVVTIISVNEDGSQILMYNDSDDKNIYLYDIENDILEKTNNKDFTNKYKGMKFFDEDHLENYEDMVTASNYAYIDKSNICYLIEPKEYGAQRGISHLQILILNKDTNKEERYTIFK